MDSQLSATRQLFDMPEEINRLPRDERGFPVPAFAAWIDGKPDFRIVRPEHWAACVKQNVCWICGNPMFRRRFFVIGPMCCINRVSSEPPSHRGCAIFAAKNCPFLTKPMAKRNERGLEGRTLAETAGIAIERNPGCMAVWEAETYKIFNAGNGYLIEVGKPKGVTFWREGRMATREEVLESVRGGVPYLIEMAEKDGPEAMNALVEAVNRFKAEILNRYTLPPPILKNVNIMENTDD